MVLMSGWSSTYCCIRRPGYPKRFLDVEAKNDLRARARATAKAKIKAINETRPKETTCVFFFCVRDGIFKKPPRIGNETFFKIQYRSCREFQENDRSMGP